MRIHDYISAIVVKHTGRISEDNRPEVRRKNEERWELRQKILNHEHVNGEVVWNEEFGKDWEKRQFKMKRVPQTIQGQECMVDTLSAIYKSREATLTLNTTSEMPVDTTIPGKQRVMAEITAHCAIPHSLAQSVDPMLGNLIELPPEIRLIHFVALQYFTFTPNGNSTRLNGLIEGRHLAPGEQPDYTTPLPRFYLEMRRGNSQNDIVTLINGLK